MSADENAGKAVRGSRSRTKRSSLSDARRLVERMKELECFYKIADLAENPSIGFKEILQGITESLPPAFQYPEISAARLLLDGDVFQTAVLNRLPTGLSAPIRVHGAERGRLDVFYLEERPSADEGPFLQQERRLLDAVAERLGHIVERRELDTERKKAERALEESREEYKSIANLSGDIILKADALGRITFLNDGACEFYGRSREELLGSDFRVLRHPEDHARTDAMLESQRSTGKGVHGYINRHLSSQGWKTVQWNTAPLYDADGVYDGFQAGGRDITDQIKTQEALRNLNAELEGFAHTVSHDLRGPLAAILLASEAFTDFAASPGELGAQEQMLRMAEVIRRNVDRSKALIADLVTLARADRFNEQTELIDIDRVLGSILEERAAEITEKGVDVDVDADMGQLMANSTHIYQLFGNLIGNALKYCNGGEGPRIRLTHTGPDDGGHHYVLRDNGPGIPDEMLGKVFEPFVKGDEGGTGIGLAIVAKIVKSYGGSISASNDGGAIFSFNLRDAET